MKPHTLISFSHQDQIFIYMKKLMNYLGSIYFLFRFHLKVFVLIVILRLLSIGL